MRMAFSSQVRAALSILVAAGASWLCYFRALKVGDAPRAVPIDRISAAHIALLGTDFLGEKLSTASRRGIVLKAIGAIPVVYKS